MKKINKLLASVLDEDVLLAIEILKQSKNFPKNLYKTGIRNNSIYKFVVINHSTKDKIVALIIGGKTYHKYLKIYSKTNKIQLL